MFTVITNQDNDLIVDLTKNSAAFVINPAATVRAAIIDTKHTRLLSSVVTCLEAAAGADWANARIVVPIAAADIAGIDISSLNNGAVKMEIQVDDNGKTTWFLAGEIVNGLIG